MADMRRMEQDISRLTKTARLDAVTLRHEVMARVARAVPMDASCASVADPASLVLTSVVGENVDRSYSSLVYRNEYARRDVGQHRVLARLRQPASVLSRATRGDLDRSPRFREVLAPMGVQHELRAAARDRGGATWGFLHLYRVAGGREFSADEASFVERAGRLLAPALRAAALVRDAQPTSRGAGSGPAVVLVSDDDSVAECTPGSARWLELLRDPAYAEQPVPEAVLGLVEWARALRTSETGEQATAIVPAADGSHAAVSAAATDHGRIAVVVQEASAAELQPFLFAGLGLTPAERELAGLVLQGRSTKDCADELTLSPHTVQDRLKTVFTKAGVRSRRELVAQLNGTRG